MLRKPEWLKVKLPGAGEFPEVKSILRHYHLHTVCEEARCPNLGECWGSGTATIMILGEMCTRSCKFCATKTGNPHGALEKDEPLGVAQAVREMGLDYVVLTSVTRDDLPDGGAHHFAETIRMIKKMAPDALIEVLIPDYTGDNLKPVVEAHPDVIGHNIETVRRLTRAVRDWRFSYEKSLKVLEAVKELDPTIYTKSSIMLGLGETKEEVLEAMQDLRRIDVDFFTLGQYLRPTHKHYPVARFIPPEEFKEYERIGLEMGFKYVASGPLVRSSYRAAEYFIKNIIKG